MQWASNYRTKMFMSIRGTMGGGDFGLYLLGVWASLCRSCLTLGREEYCSDGEGERRGGSLQRQAGLCILQNTMVVGGGVAAGRKK